MKKLFICTIVLLFMPSLVFGASFRQESEADFRFIINYACNKLSDRIACKSNSLEFMRRWQEPQEICMKRVYELGLFQFVCAKSKEPLNCFINFVAEWSGVAVQAFRSDLANRCWSFATCVGLKSQQYPDSPWELNTLVREKRIEFNDRARAKTGKNAELTLQLTGQDVNEYCRRE